MADGPAGFTQDFSCPALLRIPLASDGFGYGPVTRYGAAFQRLPLTVIHAVMRSYNPEKAGTLSVWALPRSLATTRGIIVIFFSYRY